MEEIKDAINLIWRCFVALCWGLWALLTMAKFMELAEISWRETFYPLVVFFGVSFILGIMSWVTKNGSKSGNT